MRMNPTPCSKCESVFVTWQYGFREKNDIAYCLMCFTRRPEFDRPGFEQELEKAEDRAAAIRASRGSATK